MYHIIKPEIDFPEGTDEHDPRVYDKAVANFRMFQEKGWLVQDDKPCYYIYAQTMNGKTQYAGGRSLRARLHERGNQEA